MTFYVGQKVVCVNDDPYAFDPRRIGEGTLHGLKKGRVYTVRAVGISEYWDHPSLWLKEIVRPVGNHRTEIGFNTARFRPAVERKTDISIFTAMLNPKRDRGSA